MDMAETRAKRPDVRRMAGRPPADTARLAAHEAALRRDLDMLRLPAAEWIPPRVDSAGGRILDVVVIGAGMYGTAAAMALVLKGIRNIAVIERMAPGQEGPWMSYARMPTLRSPKHLPGPALGVPALTFRAWYEACFGDEAFASLYKVFNEDWQNYLSWLQHVMTLPIAHSTDVERLRPSADGVEIVRADGATIQARRVVVATGRPGVGGMAIPAFVDADLFPDLAGHTSDMIDFEALEGRDVAVIGAGASAWDNAATALEAGAASVTMFARRSHLPQINKGRPSAALGWLEGWAALEAADKWALMAYLNDVQGPPPHETVLRTMKHERFHLRLGTAVISAKRAGNRVALGLPNETFEADFLVVGTGFTVDLGREPLLAGLAEHMALWRDHYDPPPELRRPGLSVFPWLGGAFECQPRDTGAPEGLDRIHLFNHAAYLSHGQIASDVPGVSIGAERLASGMAKLFFREDFPVMFDGLKHWDEELELIDTPLHVPVDPVTMERL